MGKDHKKDREHHDSKRKREDKKYHHEDLVKTKEQLKREKAQRKANETPEERNARRLEKKSKKKQKVDEEKNLFGFTNESNPYGDANLTKAFVWKKKYLKEAKEGKIKKELTKHELREKQLSLRLEIEKVKERKAAREVELEQMEEMRLQVERDAMREQLAGWEEKEEQFHMKQAKERSKIRIKEGREKAIDILAKNLYYIEGEEIPDGGTIDLDVELTEPHQIFSGLGSRELEELRRDIKIYLDMNQNKTKTEYWSALLVLCDDEVSKAQHRDKRVGSYGINQAFQEDVKGFFEGKNERQLEQLQEKITGKLEGTGHVDVAYWEALLKMLPMYKAKAYLRDFHAALLKKRLKQLKEQQKHEQRVESSEDEDENDWEPELLPASSKPSHQLGMSPDLCDTDSDGAVDPDEDRAVLLRHRAVVAKQKGAEQAVRKEKAISQEGQDAEDAASVRAAGMNRFLLSGDELFQKESSKPMEDDEEVMADELSTPTQTYWWHDKYRPRKPRFFNRVKTGFDWNKYNQTHYDKENPPPKIVQGYKFNVFYPDLIDPTKPPKYVIQDSEESMDHCTIRFTAGPPYEDIAFKIVKKEWEFSHKHGFKCIFDKGVLHLYFNFKRYRYRR